LDSTANRALAACEYSATIVEAIGAPYAEGESAVRDDDGNEVVDEFQDIKMESRVIQAMQETGFTQVMELDVLVDKGLAVSGHGGFVPGLRMCSTRSGRFADGIHFLWIASKFP
jgi:hypothetical protein